MRRQILGTDSGCIKTQQLRNFTSQQVVNKMTLTWSKCLRSTQTKEFSKLISGTKRLWLSMHWILYKFHMMAWFLDSTTNLKLLRLVSALFKVITLLANACHAQQATAPCSSNKLSAWVATRWLKLTLLVQLKCKFKLPANFVIILMRPS